jgi:hypothetical protein
MNEVRKSVLNLANSQGEEVGYRSKLPLTYNTSQLYQEEFKKMFNKKVGNMKEKDEPIQIQIPINSRNSKMSDNENIGGGYYENKENHMKKLNMADRRAYTLSRNFNNLNIPRGGAHYDSGSQKMMCQSDTLNNGNVWWLPCEEKYKNLPPNTSVMLVDSTSNNANMGGSRKRGCGKKKKNFVINAFFR